MGARNTRIDQLPPPTEHRGGHGGLIFVTLAAVLLVGGATYWLTRDDATKEALKSRAEELVQGTPLDKVRQLFLPPPSPPVGLSAPPTEPGTLSGQTVQGTVPAGIDPTVDPAAAGQVPALPKVEEDSVVRSLFVEDMAQWMVSRYQPGKDGGRVNIGVQSANMRYGTSLRGISFRGEDLLAGREALFRYAFSPAMLQALYALYVDRFVEDLALAAAEPKQGQPLTAQETDEMYRAYAGRFTSLARVLDNIAAVPDFRQRMENLNKSAQKAIDIHTQVGEAVFVLDEAREASKDGPIEAAQLRVNGLNAQYRRAIDERTQAQQSLVNAVRGTDSPRILDDDTVLFVAHWMERRLEKQPEALQSARAAAQILHDLAKRLHQAASVAR